MRWRGYITVPADGDYGFQTRSDDGFLVQFEGFARGAKTRRTGNGSLYVQAEGFGIEYGNLCRIGFWNKNYLNGNGLILKG